MTRTQARRNEPANNNRAVAVVDTKAQAAEIQRSIEGRRDQFLDLIGGDERLTDRLITVAMSAIVKPGSGLLDADPLSLVNAVRDSFQMGLEPAGPMGEGAIVAYNDRASGKKLAQFQPMFRGLRKLALNEPDVTVVNAGIRHAKDVFEYREGSDPFVRHEPWIDDDDPGDVMGAYAYARHRGELLVLYMNLAQIRKRQNVARSQTMWQAWPEEMMKKTVLRRLIAEKLPMRTDRIARAVSVDEADLDRSPSTPTATVAPISRTARRLGAGDDVVDDAAQTPENGSGQAEGPEAGADTGPIEQAAHEPICAARGMTEGEICTLVPGHELPHEADNGAVWG